MKGNQIWTIVGISLVVAIIASVATASITGNVIKLNQDRWGSYDVYTKVEVDTALKTLSSSIRSTYDGTCKYVNYKDSEKGVSFSGVTVVDACKRYSSIPKLIVLTDQNTLHNKQDCSPSYQILATAADRLISYKIELSNVTLGSTSLQQCNNALFKDGSSNGNFSRETFQYYSGVLCCRN